MGKSELSKDLPRLTQYMSWLHWTGFLLVVTLRPSGSSIRLLLAMDTQVAALLPSRSSIRLLLALDTQVAVLLPSGFSIRLLLALDAQVVARRQSPLVSTDVASLFSSLSQLHALPP